MANNADLTLRLLFEDKASAGLQKFGKTVAGALSVAAVMEFGRQSVQAFAEAEAAQNKLAFAFQKFPAMGNIALSSLRDYNTELMRKTGIDDDAIASGQAVLAQFKLTGQQVKDVTPLLLDYATATGRDVPQAAALLGKASLGNTRALKELGISYKATGNQAVDFAAVQGLVADKVGGFAEAEAQTAAGQLRRLDTAFGEIQESVGGALAPALVNAADGLMALSDELGPMLDDLAELTGFASDAGQALFGLADAARDLPGALPTGLLDSFGMGLGSFVTGLQNADAPVEAVKKQMADLGYTFDEASQSFVKGAGAAGTATAALDPLEAASQAAANSADDLTTSWKRLTDTLSKRAAADEAVQAVRDLKSALKGADEAFSGNSKAALENRAAIREAISAVADYAQKIENPARRSRYLASQVDLITAAMEKAGASPEEIERLVGPLTRVGGAASGAASKVQSLASQIRNLDGTSATVYINQVTGGKAVHAAGGLVTGPGGPTDDSIPAMLSNGEYVVRAAAVKRWGVGFLDAVNAAAGYGRGGRVNRPGRGRGVATQAGREEDRRIRQEEREGALDLIRDALSRADTEASRLEGVLDSLKQARDAFVESTVSGLQRSASVAGLGVSTGDDIFSARRALNMALGTEGEGAARTALADAQERSTPGWVLRQVQAKLRTMKAFGANLQRMAALGYPAEIIRDVFQQGLDGARMAEILASADPGMVAAFREAQAAVNSTAASIAAWGVDNVAMVDGQTYASALVSAGNAATAARGVAGSASAAYAAFPPIQSNIYVDGRLLVQALQDYKRSTGGAPLGLS